MKICLVTDTWDNVNGVCTTLRNTVRELRHMGHEVMVIEPSQFRTMPAVGYPEVRLSLNIWKVGRMIGAFKPDAIHIATEGPLGLAARWYCKVEKRSIPHNTSYHTKFPEYLNELFRIPVSVGYAVIRWFHKFSTKVLVTTEGMKRELGDHGFERLEVWSRGVDGSIFRPDAGMGTTRLAKPILLCVSRISREKGLDDFCGLEIEGTKILVGDGPYRRDLEARYPEVRFVGYKHGSVLAHYYAMADVFVFPSRTDTFGVVMLEAMSCGTPIAAYPVTGPLDVVEQGVNGHMDEDLGVAIANALGCDRTRVAESAKRYTWRACTETFLANLERITWP